MNRLRIIYKPGKHLHIDKVDRNDRSWSGVQSLVRLKLFQSSRELKGKHSLHIVVHRTWTQEEMGMQCRICGKVFSRNQTLPFHRHLATHDTEPETVHNIQYVVESIS